MSERSHDITDPRRPALPAPSGPGAPMPPAPAADAAVVRSAPARQLSDLPDAELHALAEELGLHPDDSRDRTALVAAVHDRRQMIAGLDRDAMVDVVRWGKRPILANATREQLAQEIARTRSMRFQGLTQPGLYVLAKLRGVACTENDPVPDLVRRLRKQESIFSKLDRKRRALMGSMIAGMLGERDVREHQYVPEPEPAEPSTGRPAPGTARVAPPRAPKSASIKDDIEESGILGGLTNRIKKTADNYLNQKLDEVEARIDRKLDEIDRRLADWRDKEIANRIRILKITLWASVVVAAVSLIYAYVREYLPLVLGR